MIRRNLSSIVYLTLLVAAALPYGIFVGFIQMPLWLSLLLCALTGLVISLVVEPVARVIVGRMQGRARVRGGGVR